MRPVYSCSSGRQSRKAMLRLQGGRVAFGIA